MKRTVISGIISFIGSLWFIGIMTVAANNQIHSWPVQLGRFWGTVHEMGLIPLASIGGLVTLLGIVFLVIEYFRKENTE